MRNDDIERVIDILKEQIPLSMKAHVKKIYIYGSCARGDFTEDSDIDVAILTDCDRIEAKKYDESLMNIVTDVAIKQIQLLSMCAFRKMNFTEKIMVAYFRNIESEGRVIYG